MNNYLQKLWQVKSDWYAITYCGFLCMFARSDVQRLNVLSSVLWCPLRFPHEHDICLQEGSLVLLTLFVFVCVKWFSTHIVCLRLVSCVPYVDSFSGLSILDCAFGYLWLLFVTLSIILPLMMTLKFLLNNMKLIRLGSWKQHNLK